MTSDKDRLFEKIYFLKVVEVLITIREICDNLSSCRKLMETMSRSKVLQKLKDNTLNKAKIIDFATNNKHSKHNLKANRPNPKLRIETEADAKRFINLIDDDFLKSELIGEEYDSLVKD